jgi:hypothetical protein
VMAVMTAVEESLEEEEPPRAVAAD